MAEKREIEFVIAPDGSVTVRVRCVKGADCVEVTRPIEEALGQVLRQEKTGEYYEEPVRDEARVKRQG